MRPTINKFNQYKENRLSLSQLTPGSCIFPWANKPNARFSIKQRLIRLNKIFNWFDNHLKR